MPKASPVSPNEGTPPKEKKSKKKKKEKISTPSTDTDTSASDSEVLMNDLDAISRFTIPFDNTDYYTITKLVFSGHTKSRQKEIEKFCDQTGITSWESLAGLGVMNHRELVNKETLADCNELQKVLYQARLKRVLAFGAITKEGINAEMTLDQIGEAVDQHTAKASVPRVVTPEKASDISLLKHRIPKLPSFNGQTAFFYKFRRDLVHEFGRYGIGSALTNEDYHQDQPAVSEAAFNALSQALSGGLCTHLADEHRNRGDLSVYNLFKALEATFDTAANKANFVVTAVKQLVDIRLDSTTTAEAFISEFQQILTDLEDNGTNLNDIRVILRAFLINAIDAEEFKNEQIFIIDHPDKSLRECFDKLRERENAHNLGDGRALKPDNGNPSLRGRRSKFAGKPNDKSDSGWKPKPWKVPPIPKNWGPGESQLFSADQFRLLTAWRNDCNGDLKNSSPKVIAEQFGVRKRRNPDFQGRPPKRTKTNRRGKKKNEDQVDEEDDDDDRDEGVEEPEFRMELNSSRIKNRRGKKTNFIGWSK